MRKTIKLTDDRTKNIKAVSLLASDDRSRPVLNSVMFTGEKAVATDGFVLAVTDCDIPEQKRAAYFYQKMDNSFVNDEGNITTLVQGQFAEIKPGSVEGQFPDYKKILNVEVKHRVAFSIDRLEKILKSIKSAKGNVIVFNLPESNKKAVKIEGKSSDIEYVIMPFLINEE